MTVEKVRQHLQQKPFVPFMLHTADGDRVRVKSPEMAWLTPGGRTIFIATGERGIDDDVVEIVDLLLVTKLTTGRRNGGGHSRKHSS